MKTDLAIKEYKAVSNRIGLGLIFVPLVVMEISKAVGLIKHHK